MQENYTIFIVNNDIRLRLLLKLYLTDQDFQIRSTTNAEQIDRILTRETIYLIILDLMLPDEYGLFICRRLRNQNNFIPIIIVTIKWKEVDHCLVINWSR
ncbi:MAG: hypothetical protein ArsCj_1810 [Arsenophonus endosymbiont of Ceratovacuna japonica]